MGERRAILPEQVNDDLDSALNRIRCAGLVRHGAMSGGKLRRDNSDGILGNSQFSRLSAGLDNRRMPEGVTLSRRGPRWCASRTAQSRPLLPADPVIGLRNLPPGAAVPPRTWPQRRPPAAFLFPSLSTAGAFTQPRGHDLDA